MFNSDFCQLNYLNNTPSPSIIGEEKRVLIKENIRSFSKKYVILKNLTSTTLDLIDTSMYVLYLVDY